MLQELRVAQTGVQVLTGFPLTLSVPSRFDEIDPNEKIACLVTLSFSIPATGFLISPVAFHRVLPGRSEPDWLVRAAATPPGSG